EQVENALVVLLDDGILAADKGVELEAQALDFDAMLREMRTRLLVMLGRLQQGLGGNATYVGAGATGSGPAFGGGPGVDARHRHAQLRGSNGGDIASGTGSDYHYVELFSHFVYSVKEDAHDPCASMRERDPRRGAAWPAGPPVGAPRPTRLKTRGTGPSGRSWMPA